MPRFTLRPATEADEQWARSAHHEALRDVVERQFGRWDVSAQDEFFRKDWTGGHFDIIEVEGVPVGYVSLEERAEDVHLRELVVVPAFQNRGIGSAIVQDVLRRADRRGVPAVLEALHENRAADLYRRLGFNEVGHDDTHTHFRALPQTKADPVG